jgi:hypothetical protein
VLLAYQTILLGYYTMLSADKMGSIQNLLFMYSCETEFSKKQNFLRDNKNFKQFSVPYLRPQVFSNMLLGEHLS